MKKMNNRGFMLTETLIVSTMLITVLLVLYIQFKSVTRSFDESFSYNTVDSTYNLYNAKRYIEQSNYSLIAERLKSNKYIDLTDCPAVFFSNTDYCDTLFDTLNIERIIMTNENLYTLINDNDFDDEFNKFLKKIRYETTDGYRLIAKFKDNTYSSIKILNSADYDFVIANECNASRIVEYTIQHLVIPQNNSTSNSITLADDTKAEVPCGSNIVIDNSALNSGSTAEQYKCYYVSAMNSGTSSSNVINIGIDPESNVGTIYYKRYESNLTIYHYLEGTNEEIADPTIVSNYCGNEIQIEQYRKTITGYSFNRVQQEKFTMERTDSSVIIYYVEGNRYE